VRILFDYRSALRHRTGVGQFAHGLASALQAALPAGDRLCLFSSSWKDRLPPHAVPGAAQVDARVPVRILNAAWHRLAWPPAEWLAGPADVAHSLHPLRIPSRSAAQLVTIHDLYFLDHPDQTAAEVRRDYASLARQHAREADGVIAVSDYTRTAVVDRLGVDPDRVTVCLAGAPDCPRRPDPPALGPILFIGTLEPRKNLPGLLKAYARLLAEWPEAPELVIAGQMTTPFATLLPADDLARLASRVRFPGYVSEDEKRRLYHEALMLVMPSFDEGFGHPALEAMTLGLPVVASRRGGLPEVLGEAALYVDPDDTRSMAEGMRVVAQDAALRRRLVDEGLRRAALFRWDAAAEGVLDAYRRAIAVRRSRR
jgi:glycosyltransferase involved in cell wall biosynthesis